MTQPLSPPQRAGSALSSTANGSSRRAMQPSWPLPFSRVRLPPWASAICRLRASPIPVPLEKVVRRCRGCGKLQVTLKPHER
jgi:hypothetical protein